MCEIEIAIYVDTERMDSEYVVMLPVHLCNDVAGFDRLLFTQQ